MEEVGLVLVLDGGRGRQRATGRWDAGEEESGEAVRSSRRRRVRSARWMERRWEKEIFPA